MVVEFYRIPLVEVMQVQLMSLLQEILLLMAKAQVVFEVALIVKLMKVQKVILEESISLLPISTLPMEVELLLIHSVKVMQG